MDDLPCLVIRPAKCACPPTFDPAGQRHPQAPFLSEEVSTQTDLTERRLHKDAQQPSFYGEIWGISSIILAGGFQHDLVDPSGVGLIQMAGDQGG